MHIGYRNQCSPTSAPTMAVPVTPILFAFKIHVTLPVQRIAQQPAIVPNTQPLSLQITTPPAQWAEPLWHHIQPHAHTDALQNAIIQRHTIRFVSNAMVHPTGYRACAWIIRGRQDLWTSKGYVPAPITDM